MFGFGKSKVDKAYDKIADITCQLINKNEKMIEAEGSKKMVREAMYKISEDDVIRSNPKICAVFSTMIMAIDCYENDMVGPAKYLTIACKKEIDNFMKIPNDNYSDIEYLMLKNSAEKVYEISP